MRKISILIVEDEPIIGMLLSEVLAGMGHNVIAVVGTEGAAVAIAAEYLPDLLIVDAGLTSGNGISAVDMILTTGFVPHLFTTGDAMKVRQLRPDAIILEKPFNESDLADAIASALTHHS
ncbi:response regulator [Sphingorhabdus sp. IMCC26285]|jgi:CheY-like chemotaxis protein|uniref:Response regulator n=1 Tax=Sphingorhabdus profundilacus TaxID=2509718 RepID=A0A6I4LTB8_9SPHN|nr:response regulator [Sphingorhabdus profundilacus]MVZ96089.1 response regulator [Sphingorhabdus profundilacus]